MAARFRKKPVVIEAIQFDGKNAHEIMDWMEKEDSTVDVYGGNIGNGAKVIITTLEGDLTASVGDWVIRGVQGEFYPCKPDIFDATYEPA